MDITKEMLIDFDEESKSTFAEFKDGAIKRLAAKVLPEIEVALDLLTESSFDFVDCRDLQISLPPLASPEERPQAKQIDMQWLALVTKDEGRISLYDLKDAVSMFIRDE